VFVLTDRWYPSYSKNFYLQIESEIQLLQTAYTSTTTTTNLQKLLKQTA
jgi:hypothetical protein